MRCIFKIYTSHIPFSYIFYSKLPHLKSLHIPFTNLTVNITHYKPRWIDDIFAWNISDCPKNQSFWSNFHTISPTASVVVFCGTENVHFIDSCSHNRLKLLSTFALPLPLWYLASTTWPRAFTFTLTMIVPVLVLLGLLHLSRV